MVAHVLVPFDGSASAERALEHALQSYPDATVTLLRVVEPLSEHGLANSEAPVDTGGVLADGTPEVAADGGDPAPRPDVPSDRRSDLRQVVVPGVPARRIVEYAEEHAPDVVVVGASERSRFERLLFGSVSETVEAEAPVPVHTVS